MFEEGSVIEENEYGQKHVNITVTLGQLANTLRELGQYAEAKACLKRALVIREN